MDKLREKIEQEKKLKKSERKREEEEENNKEFKLNKENGQKEINSSKDKLLNKKRLKSPKKIKLKKINSKILGFKKKKKLLNIPKRKKEVKKFELMLNPSEIIKSRKRAGVEERWIEITEFSNEIKCKELYNWFYIVFSEWEKYIEKNINNIDNDNKKESLKIMKNELKYYKESYNNMEPLLLNLKDQKLSQSILDKLFEIMIFARNRDYLNTNDRYIELTIGKAPWPMGVTMVGIHERKGRSKIASSQVYHILNDEVIKNYLQSVKRIISFIQKIYPKSPSESVSN